jgi:A/G-specific adenine glycosylase
MNINNVLIIWYKENARELPWKSDKNPYKIWISEILLQQTRVERAKNYYLRFISEFPTIKSLADTSLDNVLRLWQGLGYYSRARNMHTAAKQVVEQFNGIFPSTSREIATLKGIGPYTAAAVASFAFDEAVVALDGNAFRVFSRLFAEPCPINTSSARKIFSNLAQNCLLDTPSSLFNQAIMDFGSLICAPYPKCSDCPLASLCLASLQNRVMQFPVKGVKKTPRNRYFYYLHITQGEHTFIQQRLQKDIWQNLYQFPLIETDKPVKPDALPDFPEWNAIFGLQTPRLTGCSSQYVHRLTHQTLYTFFMQIQIEKESEWLQSHCKKILALDIDRCAISRLTERYLLDESTNYISLPNANLLD